MSLLATLCDLKAPFTPSASRRVASTRVDATTFGLLASNVCIFIQLSITSLLVTSLSMTSLAQVSTGGGV